MGIEELGCRTPNLKSRESNTKYLAEIVASMLKSILIRQGKKLKEVIELKFLIKIVLTLSSLYSFIF